MGNMKESTVDVCTIAVDDARVIDEVTSDECHGAHG